MLALTTNAPGMGSTIGSMVLWIAVMGVLFYFMLFRPQKKQQNEMKQMLASLEVGDSVLTTSGFYGVVIDITDDTVIIEFGNNKNCRIPMQKTAITQIEKPNAE
ncbi:MAG: preprotein translocase subunit YajC [Lachnospiraceae bacterium]|nr:preprotein translocase subunit YajC [Lachnospiraceae bacterium]